MVNRLFTAFVHYILELLSTLCRRQCRDNREFSTVDMPSLLCREKTLIFKTLVDLNEAKMSLDRVATSLKISLKSLNLMVILEILERSLNFT